MCKKSRERLTRNRERRRKKKIGSALAWRLTLLSIMLTLQILNKRRLGLVRSRLDTSAIEFDKQEVDAVSEDVKKESGSSTLVKEQIDLPCLTEIE